MALIGAVVSAVGMVMQADAQSKMYEYKAQVGRMYAQQARDKGAADESTKRMETTGLVNQVAASQGASGLSVSSPTFADVRASAAELGEQDANTVRHNAALRAWAFEAQAEADQFAASAAKTQGFIGAASALAGGFSSMMGSSSSVSPAWQPFKTAAPAPSSPYLGYGPY